jgi:anti-sigma B factor antagonist
VTLSEIPIGHARVAIIVETLTAAAIVHVFGELDLMSAPELERAIEKAAREHEVVVVDFAECRYLDSTTLSALVRSAKLLGERLRIVVPTGALIARVFSITMLDKVLRIATSVDAAVLPADVETQKQMR